MENTVDLKNKVCVLVDPETRHIEYIPLDEIKVKDDITISGLFNKFEELSNDFKNLKKSTDVKIDKLITIINILEGQIKILSANQSRLGECYNTLHEAFKKQTTHSLASILNIEYAIKLLGGKL